MMNRRVAAALATLALVAASCGTTTGGGPAVAATGNTGTSEAAPAATVTSEPTTTLGETAAETTTTTAIADQRRLDVTLEPPPWEEVTIETADGIELFGRFWEGGDVAVIVGHDFDNPTPGSAGQRPPQSSENALPYTAAIVREGFTVLAFDWRGHGSSGGQFDIRSSPTDLEAVYSWVAGNGFEKVFMVGWQGAGTSAVVADAASPDIEFDGIALLFSPPQDIGLNADAVLGEIDGLTLFIGTNGRRTGSWAKRMEAKATNSFGVFNFEPTPTGLQFIDVFGGELAGRVVDLVETATA
ncbi:MAG: CocE/NonD family hydrolase [Acidimicrobiia bacterium]